MHRMLQTLGSALLLLLTACTPQTESEHFCSQYQIQEIRVSDPFEERMQKLEENSYYQHRCQ